MQTSGATMHGSDPGINVGAGAVGAGAFDAGAFGAMTHDGNGQLVPTVPYPVMADQLQQIDVPQKLRYHPYSNYQLSSSSSTRKNARKSNRSLSEAIALVRNVIPVTPDYNISKVETLETVATYTDFLLDVLIKSNNVENAGNAPKLPGNAVNIYTTMPSAGHNFYALSIFISLLRSASILSASLEPHFILTHGKKHW
ncbi:PREDICTED: twist-related protein 1-like [Vollenhovia emeryi]|uniref:twist-related protein 1-like n=1 Tax=Vollenhovia emeryi TaxID=411798 RepID=UPI0005F52A4C|nr:PREDICTED: twist-related protein 1-like [Vollenhovia emeryi]